MTMAAESWKRVKEVQDQMEALNGQLAEARKGVTVASKLLEGVTDALTQNAKAAETLIDDVAKFVSSCPREVEESSYALDFMKKSVKMQKMMARCGADPNSLVEYAVETCPSFAERNNIKGGTDAVEFNASASGRVSSSTIGHRNSMKFANAQNECKEDVVGGKKRSKRPNTKKVVTISLYDNLFPAISVHDEKHRQFQMSVHERLDHFSEAAEQLGSRLGAMESRMEAAFEELKLRCSA